MRTFGACHYLCRHRHRDARRSSRRENIVSIVNTDPSMEAFSKVPDAGESPDRHTARLQIRQVLERKVGELPETLRLVFVLRSIEELSVEDTADTLSISQDAVRTRHLRAKSVLREALAKDINLAQGDIYEFGGECCDRVVATVLARIHGPPSEK
jgi:RNA polymerase sigma factor (sigma-70 family)